MDNPQHSLDDALVEKVARALCNANFFQQGAEGEFGTWWSWRNECRAALNPRRGGRGMTTDDGRSPSGPGHSRAEPEEVSALRASVPNAADAVAVAARRFCSELCEDADGVPQPELKALHAALDVWEAAHGDA